MGKIFTAKYLVLIVSIFILSTAFSYGFLSEKPAIIKQQAKDQNKADPAIDQALEFSVIGEYEKSFPLFQHLSDSGVIRAKLYLAVAYYHGQGVDSDKSYAKKLFLELKDMGYESDIANTYLGLIGYIE